MRIVLLIFAVLAVIVVACGVWIYLKFKSQFPPTSTEVIVLTPDSRARLTALRNEHKFQPNGFPPLGYTHAESPEDEAVLNASVNGLIDAILARPDGTLPAHDVAALIGKAGKRLSFLPTEDRERAGGYMIEVWYILGFKGATGRFAHGSAFPVPPGYTEPLPPGWTAPDHPRPIG